ncbi:hypothetical protein AGMMS50262_09890 [Bacteroidia bacterium]|nr:hypothetical protein AGMMS50262_09890 [Bacteroidia bacterium]
MQKRFTRTAEREPQMSDPVLSALPAYGTSMESLNKASYANFRNYLRRMVPELPYNQLNDDTFNQKLQIVRAGCLTYGGLLFLGDNDVIRDYFPDFRVDFLEIPGFSYADAKPRIRIPEQENLWEYYYVLFQRLQTYAEHFFGKGKRAIEGTEKPHIDALREGLINMLIHSDYGSPLKSRIRVFVNRIEFENPGVFPRPVAELMKENVSIPRNPVLAKLFRCADLCENVGYGFDKMLLWKKATNQDVFFENAGDTVKVTFML